MASEDKDSDIRKSMQESWVEVKPQQQEGTLAHSHSLEQMEELLASAVSEKEEGGGQLPGHQEPTTLTSPTLFEVRFEPAPAEDELADEEPVEEAESTICVQMPVTQPLIVDDHKKGSPPPRPRRNRRRVLFLLVPVLLLTHLAFFGIGYYLGRRFSVETVTTVFHV